MVVHWLGLHAVTVKKGMVGQVSFHNQCSTLKNKLHKSLFKKINKSRTVYGLGPEYLFYKKL